jgi:endonuclease/exonuclease/phosphatase family metal-dependent hydrolase
MKRRVLLPVSLLALSPIALSIPLACDPFHTQFDDSETAAAYEAKTIRSSSFDSRLRIMTYNVKFGGGRIDFFFDCHGDEVLMSESTVETHLQGLAELIRAADPDVLFLQEVDVLSKRAAYVDQVQWLLDETDLNYGVYASQWKADYVPSDGIGAVDSGNAILAKWPLENPTRLALPLRSDQSGIERYFYLKRNILIADLEIEHRVRLVATHAAAYSTDGTKAEQVRLFEEQLDQAPGLVIGAGDLNTLPPGTDKQHEFPDSVCTDEDFIADDYRQEADLLASLYDKYETAIPLSEYQADNSAHFTHTTDGGGFWNRKLDYVFTNATVVPGSGVTHQDATSLGIETMPLSDHAPITVEVDLP